MPYDFENGGVNLGAAWTTIAAHPGGAEVKTRTVTFLVLGLEDGLDETTFSLRITDGAVHRPIGNRTEALKRQNQGFESWPHVLAPGFRLEGRAAAAGHVHATFNFADRT